MGIVILLPTWEAWTSLDPTLVVKKLEEPFRMISFRAGGVVGLLHAPCFFYAYASGKFLKTPLNLVAVAFYLDWAACLLIHSGRLSRAKRYSSTVSYSPAICSRTAGVMRPRSVIPSNSRRAASALLSKTASRRRCCSIVSLAWKMCSVISSAAG